jgi:hypothetical protein
MSSSHRDVFLWRRRVISFLVCHWIFLWTNRQTPTHVFWILAVGHTVASLGCERAASAGNNDPS